MQNPCNSQNLNVSAIIPAYNEAGNIINVLRPLRQVPAIKEIIVVSDGSSDDTEKLVRDFDGAKIIALPKNVGKTRAVIRGVADAEHPTIMFCDADLINLKKHHISALIAKYCEGFDMVIMDKGSQPWVFRDLVKSAPAVSGTRILDKKHFHKVLFLETDRFQFEIRINDYFLEKELSISVTPAEEIHDPRKFVKYPFLKGLILDLKGGFEVLASDGPPSILKNLENFQKIKEISYPSKQSRHIKISMPNRVRKIINALLTFVKFVSNS
jgi:glycosyltransferase involved in cell wall biosynthesis